MLRDGLIEKMRRAGISVSTDWQEGERILAQENARTLVEHFAESKEEFDIIREIVAKEKGVVTPGLAEMDFSVVPVKLHDFTSEKPIEEGLAWAKENLVTTKKDLERGELPKMKDGESYTISTNAITKFLSEKAVGKSDNVHIHLSVLKVLKEVIGESIDSELRPDYPKDENDNRLPLKYNKNGLIHILYGAVNIDNNIYRVKTTMQEFRGNETSKPHSYEAVKIELLDSPMAASFIRSVNVGQKESDTKEFTRISISGANLLNNVEKSKDYGKKLLDESKKSEVLLENSRFLPDTDAIISEKGVTLLAPDGQPSNLTPELYDYVRTIAFKEWFGDYYTNQKARPLSKRMANADTLISADAYSGNALSTAKVQQNSEIAKENSENIREHRVSDENTLAKVVSGAVSREEVQRAMDSRLVKGWIRNQHKTFMYSVHKKVHNYLAV